MTRVKVVAMATLVALAMAAGAYRLARNAGDDAGQGDPLTSLLAHRGTVGWYGASPRDDGAGVRFQRIDPGSALGRAFESSDPSVVRRALDAAHIRTVVLETARAAAAPPSSFLGRFGRFEAFDGFRTVALETSVVVVEPNELPPFTDDERAALPRVARQILAGGTPPRLSQFPSHLRAPVPVEVMLSLRRGDGELALWRSARASSVASGLLTATRVAMERWQARQENLGSPLRDALPGFDVEVALLVDDGTLLTRAEGFLDRAVRDVHGVAYDQPSSWHYLLPDAPERRGRSGSAAFRALFADTQRRADSFSDDSIRLYRLRVLPLGIDRARDARDR